MRGLAEVGRKVAPVSLVSRFALVIVGGRNTFLDITSAGRERIFRSLRSQLTYIVKVPLLFVKIFGNI